MCEMYLHAKYPEFQTVDGRGGDDGIDGFICWKEHIFQFHHPLSGGLRLDKLRLYLKQAQMHEGIKKWTFLCSASPTKSGWEYIESQRATVPFEISIIAASNLAEEILKFPHIREEFFPRETLQTTKKVLSHTAKIKRDVEHIRQRLSRAKVERPRKGDAPEELRMTEEHKSEMYARLQQCAEQEAKIKRRKNIPYKKWFGEFNANFILSDYSCLPDSKFLEARRYLEKRLYADRLGEKRIDTRNRLIKQVKVTQKQLGWNDPSYRLMLQQWFNVSSSTELDIPDLQKLASRMKNVLASR